MNKNYSSFKKFELSNELIRSLTFRNFKKPTEIQSKSIPLILQGHNVIISSKTGTGKTLSYLIPIVNILEKHSTTIGSRLLILLPTRELAIQTCSVLKRILISISHNIEEKKNCLSYSLLVGGHNYQGQFEELAKNPDIIIATPGRLIELISQVNFSLSAINFLVIDEADQMFELGFKPQIKKISEKWVNLKQTIFVSATIPKEINEFAAIKKCSEFKIVTSNLENKLPEKLQLHFLINNSNQKLNSLIFLLSNYILDSSCIVFVHSRHVIDFIESFINYEGFMSNLKISFIHGNMDNELRNERMMLFKNKKNNILIVTDLVARGIDIPDVEYIINYDISQSFKNFIHRSGRTARIEKSGSCINLINKGEEPFIFDISHRIKRDIYKDQLDFDLKTFNNDNLNKKLIYVGIVPFEILSQLDQKIEYVKNHIDNLESTERILKNSYKRFNKLQEKPSQKSILLSKKEKIINVHPIFISLENNSKNLINDIKNYKAKESYLYKKVLTDEKKLNVDFLKNKEKVISEKVKIKNNIKQNLNQKKKEKEFNFENKNLKSWKMNKVNKSMYLSNEQDDEKIDKMNSEENLNSQNDVVFLTDNNNNEMFVKKKFWDQKKKKYLQYDVDLEGNVLDSKKIYKLKRLNNQNSKIKKIYNLWKQDNNLSIQRIGEKENKDIIKNAKNSFILRKKNKFRMNNYSNDKKSNYKRELKNPNELLKLKKTKLKKKLKNMPKKNRENILKKRIKKN